MSCPQSSYLHYHQASCSSLSLLSSKQKISWISTNPFPSHISPYPQPLVTNSSPSHVQLTASTSSQESPKPSSSVWINPRSRKPSRLRERSHQARHTVLLQIARTLDSSPLDQIPQSLANFSEKLSLWEQDAVTIINHMSNPDAALLTLRFFRGRLKKEVIVYNVTFKVLRSCRDFARAENLFDEMLARGVPPNNVTFSTIITSAMVCNLPHKAVEWFEKMPSFGVSPDDVTLSAMIDAYGRAENLPMAFCLYDRARSENWRLDPVVFSTLIKLHSQSQNYDGCLNVYEEMKALGVKPNVVVYNTLLEAIGRARRPWQAKTIFNEMLTFGLSPNRNTFSALLRAYCKGRYHTDGLQLYRVMKEKEIPLQITLYNALLAMFADLGFFEEALEVYEDMKARNVPPDSYTFSSLITVFSCAGKVADVESILDDMVSTGLEPSLFILTSLVQCYGKARRIDDVVRICRRLSELEIPPDDHFYGCLLNVITQSSLDEIGKIIEWIAMTNPNLGDVLKLLVSKEASKTVLLAEAHGVLCSISYNAKKAYCNCLIDICVNLEMEERAAWVLELGQGLNIYTNLKARTASEWTLHLKGLSVGAAVTAVREWKRELMEAVREGEELPPLLGINTGHGKHKFSINSLAGMLQSHLRQLNAPFHEFPDKEGWLYTTRVAALSWLVQ